MKLVLGESMVATSGGFSRGHPGLAVDGVFLNDFHVRKIALTKIIEDFQIADCPQNVSMILFKCLSDIQAGCNGSIVDDGNDGCNGGVTLR